MSLVLDRLENHRWERWVIVLLIIAAVAPYAQTLGFGYVYDDTVAIRSNPDLRGWGALGKIWTHTYGGGDEATFFGLYRPVTMTLFALVWNAGGGWPLWFHLMAVAMHAVATILIWRVLERGVGWVPAGLAALWFAVHPVHVEAVANVGNSSEVLVAVFTCALVLHVTRLADRDGAISWRAAAIAGVLYLAAFLSKESGAMAPMLAALCVWGWRTDAPRSTLGRAELRRWTPVIAAFAGALAIVLALRSMVLGGPVTGESIAATGIDEFSTPQRVRAMVSLGPTILRLLVWPAQLNPHYGPTTFPVAAADTVVTFTVVFLFAAVGGAAWLARKGDRRALTAIAWITVAFLPASNLLIATGQILAERTLYVPSIGVAMLLGLLLRKLPEVGRPKQPWLVAWPAIVAAVAFVALLFAARTARGTRAWRNHETLFAQMIAADTAGYVGYWFTGVHAGRNGRMDQALTLLERAYARYPRDRGLQLDYADALLQNGHAARAAAIVSELMRDPRYRAKPTAVAVYLDATGRAFGADSVVAAAERLMASTPSPTAVLFLGQAHAVRGDSATAIAIYRDGLRAFPGDSVLRLRLDSLGLTR